MSDAFDRAINDPEYSRLCLLVNAKERSLVTRSRRLGIAPPDHLALTRVVFLAYKRGFRCAYCGRAIALDAPKESAHAPSIDHRVPIALFGTNAETNLAVVCYRCNIVKGTMTERTFRMVLDGLKARGGAAAVERYLAEAFAGSAAAARRRQAIGMTADLEAVQEEG